MSSRKHIEFEIARAESTLTKLWKLLNEDGQTLLTENEIAEIGSFHVNKIEAYSYELPEYRFYMIYHKDRVFQN